MIEHEKKYSIRLTGKLRQKILDFGFFEKGDSHQRDTYYSRKDVDFMKTKECLRIREESDTAELTYKPPTTKQMLESDSIWKQEINIAINLKQIDDLDKILQALGCKKLCTVDKKRKTFVKQHITIVIDTIANLGNFVEIEILNDKQDDSAIDQINKIAKELGINQQKVVTLPYRDLLMLSQGYTF